MGFFSGPSSHVTLGIANGVAVVIRKIQLLDQLDTDMRKQAVESMKADGEPTTIEELVTMAALVVTQQKMGWLKKNQYLGASQSNLIAMGMSHADAAYFKGMIEIKANVM